MEFHEHLHSIGTREGLKERKLQKAVESFTWNITILKVPSGLLLVLVVLQTFSACFFLSGHFVHIIHHWRLCVLTGIQCPLPSESLQAPWLGGVAQRENVGTLLVGTL